MQRLKLLSWIVFIAVPAFAWGQAPAKPRLLAPGILTVIPSDPHEEEMYSGPRQLVEIPANFGNIGKVKPNYEPLSKTINEQSKVAILRRTIWNLEFAFKPLRMMYIDVPQATGKMQRKLIWYMVYRVKNNGKHWKPVEKADEFGHLTFDKEMVDMPLRFFPQFVLQAHEFEGKQYLDRVVPAAIGPIKKRELPDKDLFDSLTISGMEIPVSEERADKSVWGVVTWEDVDPRIDYCSVYIQGLTNAYQFDDPPGAYKTGSPPATGRKFVQKTLQLNFWRPGDAIDESEEEVRYGVRIINEVGEKKREVEQKRIFDLYGVKDRLDSLWIYR